ncbi:flagellar biosynthetic protein FliQ, partial [Escherichia coli]|uniref:flagellar biosynthetic protein FliQ n=1 Tax=Escherichia coli TaxID=562 RepID=UPI0010CB695C
MTVAVAADIVASGLKGGILLVSVLGVPSLLVGLLVGVCQGWCEVDELPVAVVTRAILRVLVGGGGGGGGG